MKQVYDGMASFLGIDTAVLQLELMRACRWGCSRAEWSIDGSLMETGEAATMRE